MQQGYEVERCDGLLLFFLHQSRNSMKFFIDTANLAQIAEAKALGILDGVTTNPSLMAKEGITGKQNIYTHYKKICDLVDGDVSAEVISTDLEGMLREGKELAEIADNIVVKIPMIKEGIKAICEFNIQQFPVDGYSRYYNQLGNGTAILQTAEQLNTYLASYADMHQHKLTLLLHHYLAKRILTTNRLKL